MFSPFPVSCLGVDRGFLLLFESYKSSLQALDVDFPAWYHDSCEF